MRKICLRLQSSIFRLTHSFADIGKPLTLDRDGTSGPAEQDTATTWRAQSTADHELRGRLSYVHGGCEKALLGQTISENFGVMATRGPDSLAVASMHQQRRQSYAELHAAMAEVARGLLSLGVGPGDRVAMYSPNNIEWITTMYAVASIGAVLVPLNPSYRSLELARALMHSKAKLLITAAKSKGTDMLQTVHAALQEVQQSGSNNMLEHVVTLSQTKNGVGAFAPQTLQPASGIRNLCWTDIIAAAADTSHTQLATVSGSVQFDDAAQIQYTSGTTGQPKGVMLSHHSLLNNAYFIGEENKYTEQDKVCLPVPLFHCFGCVLGALAITTHGASMVFPGEGFDPGQTLQAVQQERCTALYGVPTMFIAELAHSQFATFDLRTLKKGIMAGSLCPQEVMQKVIDKMHMTDITICYGMTETSPVSFQSSQQDSIEHRVSTIGRVHPHVEAKVIDSATGNIVPRNQTVSAAVTRQARQLLRIAVSLPVMDDGSAWVMSSIAAEQPTRTRSEVIGDFSDTDVCFLEKSELCTRGYSVMLGYWEDVAATQKVIDSARWMHTGDLAAIDDEGYCRIVGRLKDVIIRGGENISPREIEEVIHQHEAVMDVQVIGVLDKKYGEEVCAWVRLNPQCAATAHELQQWCQGAIAAYKIPRYWRFVDSYPLTASGKVQKYLMRQTNYQDVTDCGKLSDKSNSGLVSFY